MIELILHNFDFAITLIFISKILIFDSFVLLFLFFQ